MTPTETTTKVPLWLKLVLAGSLTLNLMVVGVIVGARIGDSPFNDRHGPRETRNEFDPSLGPFARAMPEEYRNRAAQALRDKAGDPMSNRMALAAQVESMITALRAEPFDPALLSQTMSDQNNYFRQRAIVARDVVLEQINEMSAEERAALADRLENGFQRAINRSKP